MSNGPYRQTFAFKLRKSKRDAQYRARKKLSQVIPRIPLSRRWTEVV